MGEFRSLNVSGDFEVTLSKGDYSAKVTVDQVLADYVDVYVRTGVLYIKYNEKDVPKEVKKDLKKKTKAQRAKKVLPKIPIWNLMIKKSPRAVFLPNFSDSCLKKTKRKKKKAREKIPRKAIRAKARRKTRRAKRVRRARVMLLSMRMPQ